MTVHIYPKEDLNEIVVHCDCYDDLHHMRIFVDEWLETSKIKKIPYIEFTMQLSRTQEPFWERFKLALRILFKLRFNYWEILVTLEQFDILTKEMNTMRERIKE